MRRAGNLYPSVVSFPNLMGAAHDAALGKRRRPDVARFALDLEPELVAIQRDLTDHTYTPGPYRTFWLREPKARMISAAPFRDRVVHHALCRVIEPVLDRSFISESYACRDGKGNHRALTRFVEHCRRHRYVLTCDVRKFFPSIDHEIVLGLVRRRIKDPEVLWLLSRLVACSCDQEPAVWHFPGDGLLTPVERRRGLPIGNLTSQLLANVMLDPLDHFIKQELGERAYLRYCDDFAIFGDDKQRLGEVRRRVEQTLWGLRLRLNERKSRVRRTDEGISFLGFHVLPGRLRVKRESVRRFERRLGRLRRDLDRRDIHVEDVTRSVRAWLAHARHADSHRLCEAILSRAVF